MIDLIKNELQRVLADWDAGKPVRSLALGHAEQNIRQKVAHTLAFELIRQSLSDDGLLHMNAIPKEITKSEEDAAISLAAVAKLQGWNRAIAGFPEAQYITIQKDGAK